jgi:hypothetical protein
VFRIISPFPYAQTSTEGSERFNFFKPSSSFGASLISYVDTLTFSIDFVCEETGTKEIQSYEVETVPDLNMKVSRPPIPTTHPAETSSTPSGY